MGNNHCNMLNRTPHNTQNATVEIQPDGRQREHSRKAMILLRTNKIKTRPDETRPISFGDIPPDQSRNFSGSQLLPSGGDPGPGCLADTVNSRTLFIHLYIGSGSVPLWKF